MISERDLSGAQRILPVPYDWNRDGSKDIIVGGMDGTIRIYLDHGSDESPGFNDYFLLKAGKSIVNVGSRSAPRIYDFNKDGLNDILVGELFGYVYFLKNVGSDDDPALKRVDKLFLKHGDALKYPGESPRSRLDVTDWNNDGIDDIIVGGGDGKVMLFLASQDTSISLTTLMNRAKASALESVLKVINKTKTFLKTVRGRVSERSNS